MPCILTYKLLPEETLASPYIPVTIKLNFCYPTCFEIIWQTKKAGTCDWQNIWINSKELTIYPSLDNNGDMYRAAIKTRKGCYYSNKTTLKVGLPAGPQ